MVFLNFLKMMLCSSQMMGAESFYLPWRMIQAQKYLQYAVHKFLWQKNNTIQLVP